MAAPSLLPAQPGRGPILTLVALLLDNLAIQGRIGAYLKEPKPRISLAEKSLSPAELASTMALVGGRTMKEIGFDFEVAESTVRTILARAYKKLEVEDKSGLAALAEKFDIVA